MSKDHVGEICSECNGKVMPIMWGMPTEQDAQEADRQGWYIGGCIVDERVSRCECGATGYDADGQLATGERGW